ncbi:CHAP domain-containing protein [Pseudoroseomonas cervicalis]|uniref:CHAP domain-containing protein n=1 Tax=Teichococcus cervicalis TaxID=204525 RepID=UPI0022F1DB9C|nr:CHAP domain-containing protein [Pseudoroseomonas cervicalis]WBV42294.1 CHAP domain-containing protein [Pseudoroseomonas cervicalis]
MGIGGGAAALRPLMLLGLLLLAACGGGGAAPRGPVLGAEALREPVTCVPYARARSGVDLRGDAWQWWDAAAGFYERGAAPRPGSVLVLARSGRMRDGHLAVVSRVVSSREIRVDHANWASGSLKGRIMRDQPVLDVSPRNDWSVVKVWYPPSGAYGVTAYPAAGFVHPRSQWAAR